MSHEQSDTRVSPGRSAAARRAYPDQLLAAEMELIRERRAAAELERPDARDGLPADTVGLALSGGGIRSATFCLGLLQGLSARQLLGSFDLLSTVSGGGYIGAFLGSLFSRPDVGPGKNGNRVSEASVILTDSNSWSMRWLRENGRYLSPNGSGDLWAALSVQLVNWCSVVAAMGLFGLTLLLGVNALRGWLAHWPAAREFMGTAFPLPAGSDFWWWSPALALAALTAVPAAVIGWSTWLIPRPRNRKRMWASWAATIVCVAGSAAVLAAGRAPEYRWFLWGIALLGGLSLLSSLVVVLSKPSMGQTLPAEPRHAEWRRIARVRLVNGLARFLALTVGLLAFGVLDSAGQSLYLFLSGSPQVSLKALAGAAGVTSLLSLGQKLAGLSKLFPASTKKLPLETIATIAGTLGFGLFLLGVDVLGHAIAWNWAPPGPPQFMSVGLLAVAGLAGLVLSLLIGHNAPFLNGSSQQLLYGSRLARAYLGASNPNRKRPGSFPITDMIKGDDIWRDEYKPYKKGGPLHLINLTFNETCSAKSQTEQRDRKGLQFAVGPRGLSVGRHDHALWRAGTGEPDRLLAEIEPVKETADADFALFPMPGGQPEAAARLVENISIGHWIALSGAAFGTGTGAHNSLGFSLIAGLANVRLGYWWDSGVDPGERKCATPPSVSLRLGRRFAALFPVQSYLLDEWLARFHGPARPFWYLSDGGHFENTGVYELIRRRVPHIVCCDCGEDPSYDFADVSNLVRKARIDFDAEIEIYDRPRIDDLARRGVPSAVLPEIGTPEEFADAKTRKHHALLADVRYEGGPPESLILFVKPAVAGDEPADVREYQRSHPAFPDQATTDQFFDEAQWESYRMLGEHCARRLLVPAAPSPWWFPALRP